MKKIWSIRHDKNQVEEDNDIETILMMEGISSFSLVRLFNIDGFD